MLPTRIFGLEVGTWGQLAGATMTFLAVAVALFRDEVLRWWKRPKLEVSFVLKSPDCQKANFYLDPSSSGRAGITVGGQIVPDFVDCYFLRLRVRNDGKTRAEQVQVYVAGLSERRGKTFKPVESFFPANLTWTHGLPNAGRTVFAAGISPKMEKHCDLARVLDPTNPGVRQALRENVDGVAAAECLLTLQLEDTPATKSHLVPPGTYRLTLRVAGANSAPRDVTIELTMTGKWFADEDQMFAEGLWATVV